MLLEGHVVWWVVVRYPISNCLVGHPLEQKVWGTENSREGAFVPATTLPGMKLLQLSLQNTVSRDSSSWRAWIFGELFVEFRIVFVGYHDTIGLDCSVGLLESESATQSTPKYGSSLGLTTLVFWLLSIILEPLNMSKTRTLLQAIRAERKLPLC